jgi:hypothetical protein
LDQAYKAFETSPVNDWIRSGTAWQGFYQFLEKEIDDFENWAFVNNPSGGFWAAVLLWSDYRGFSVYIQIEELRLCFKIGFSPEETDTEEVFNANEIQDEWQQLLIEGARKAGLTEIKRPSTYRHSGTYRTVAYVEAQDWLYDPTQAFNKSHTIERLQSYINFQKELCLEKQR